MKKILALVLATVIIVSAFSFVAVASARPFMNWRTYQNGRGNSHRFATAQSFVRVDGVNAAWGTQNVTGTMGAQARTVAINSTASRQGITATALWTANTSRPISGIRDKTNFTYTFYTARLVNASTASLNTTGYSLFINGSWNVFQVSTAFTVVTDTAGNVVGYNRTENAHALATKAYGELTVSSDQKNFTITIDGIDPLTGLVRAQRITTKIFNPFKTNSDDGTIVVTKLDVSNVVTSYGSSPGWGKYDQRMDYNFNYKIDIADLATAAANINV